MIEKDRHIDLTDIELQKILDDYAEASLRALEDCAPPDLESRLDATISRLAHNNRRRRIWIRASAAAASIAIIMTAGIGVMRHHQNIPAAVTAEADIPDTDSGSLIPEFPTLASVTSSNEENANQKLATYTPATRMSASSSANVAPRSQSSAFVKSSSFNPSPSVKTKVAPAVRHSENHPVEIISEQLSATPANQQITAAVSASSLTPQLTPSVAIPDNLPLSPSEASVLASSKEISNMRESLDKVNAVFYEARKIASSLSEDVVYAATSSLRSI